MRQSTGRAIETHLIHAGEPDPRVHGAVAMPIFQSSTYLTDEGADYHDLRYIRLNNTPNHHAVHEKLAILEGGEAALVASSGMAAISTTLLTVLQTGDHLLAHNCLYGGTHDFITRDLKSFGISHTFVDGNDPTTWPAALRDTTKVIYMESITNPLLEVAELQAAVEFARKHGLVSLIDGTFATPINFCPLAMGYDAVLHSATKYLNGHNDIVAGVAVGSTELVERIRHRLNHLGGSLDPHACFLLHRGLKTLAVRVRYQNDSAMRIASVLEERSEVVRVNYPGLERHPHHRRAREWFSGFGGMVSFELNGGGTAAARFLERVRIPIKAPSLGGVDSLITQPAKTSHVGLTADERRRIGIGDGLIRLSVGLESTDDLIEDIAQALGG